MRSVYKKSTDRSVKVKIVLQKTFSLNIGADTGISPGAVNKLKNKLYSAFFNSGLKKTGDSATVVNAFSNLRILS